MNIPYHIKENRCQTRNGRPVVVHGTNGQANLRPVIASVSYGDGDWQLQAFRADGAFHADGEESGLDLVAIPELAGRVPRVFRDWRRQGKRPISDDKVTPQNVAQLTADGWSLVTSVELLPGWSVVEGKEPS